MSTVLSSQNNKLLSTDAVQSVVGQKSSIKSVSRVENFESKLSKITQCYQADQQVKYLHLQAEIDVLIQKLQSLKNQKQH